MGPGSLASRKVSGPLEAFEHAPEVGAEALVLPEVARWDLAFPECLQGRLGSPADGDMPVLCLNRTTVMSF